MTENTKKLYRSNKDRMFGGVCGGLGEFLNMDSTLIRLTFALLAIFGFGSAIVLYIVMLLIVPEEPTADVPVATPPAE